MSFPRVYAIVDAGCFAAEADLFFFAEELLAAGLGLLQYRNKGRRAWQMLAQARELRRRFPATTLIMNDRADLCVAAGFDGVHVGQDDLSPEGARAVVGPHLWVGVSTHNPEQLYKADLAPVTYIAVGPVFSTPSKRNPDPVIGLDGVRAARAATQKPLVAIGGITRQNCRALLDAGADSVAVISDLLGSPRKSAEDFLRILG